VGRPRGGWEVKVRIANVDGRLKVLVEGGAVDVERASSAFEYLDDLRDWASGVSGADEAWDASAAGPPVPSPRQSFAIGLNYAAHAEESGFDRPIAPVVFTKWPSSLSGPVTEVVLPEGSVDWEVEMVAVIGRSADRVSAARAWDHIAGVTVGQDLSERELQRSGPVPQFGLGKSHRGFSPTGPVMVTVDELEPPLDLALGCDVNGEEMQKGRTAEMIFGVPELVAYLSSVVTLFAGDIIFTGTPPGVGMGRTPPRYLSPGDHLHSWVEGIGALDQHFVAAAASPQEGQRT
jgi:2,4-diketo-3-deoxy-L-fuconate hydrolase